MINYILKFLSEKRLKRRVQKIKHHISNKNSHLLSSFVINLYNPEKEKIYLKLGNNSIISCKITFESKEGEVIVGNNSFLGSSHLICRNKIIIEDNVFMAWGCTIYDHNSHSLDYRDRENDILQQLEDLNNGENFVKNKNWDVVDSKPIIIKSNSWIGMNCIILKGVTIGEGAIVGAGSVVTKNIADWTVVAGNPARVIKTLPENLRKK